MIPVIVLCGGKGTRLKKAWPGQKCMAAVGGQPFLVRVMGQFSPPLFVLAAGHRGADVTKVIGQKFFGTPVLYAHHEGGTAAAVRDAVDVVAASRLAGRPRAYWIVNGDTHISHFADEVPGGVAMAPLRFSVLITMLASVAGRGVVTATSDGIVRSYRKAGRGSDFGVVNAGALLLRGRDLEHLNAGDSMDDDVLPSLVRAKKLESYQISGRAIEIDTPERLARARRILRAR